MRSLSTHHSTSINPLQLQRLNSVQPYTITPAENRPSCLLPQLQMTAAAPSQSYGARCYAHSTSTVGTAQHSTHHPQCVFNSWGRRVDGIASHLQPTTQGWCRVPDCWLEKGGHGVLDAKAATPHTNGVTVSLSDTARQQPAGVTSCDMQLVKTCNMRTHT